jgi:hypothetical protein
LKASTRIAACSVATIVLTAFFLIPWAAAQDSTFHNAPASAKGMKNPYESQPSLAGKPL